MNDLAIDTLHVALRGLSARQRTLSDNVANVETPTFLAGRVDFEASLRDAVAGSDAYAAEVTSRRSLAPTLVNGNNVNLVEESMALADTELRYQLAVNGISSKFRTLRTAIGS